MTRSLYILTSRMETDMTRTRTAKRRYLRNMLVCAFGYCLSLFAVISVIVRNDPGLPLAVGLALIPAAFVLGMLAAIWTYMRDMDEVARHFVTRSMMFGTFAVLTVAGTWGLLEMIVEGLPALPVFWMFPLFFLVMGVTNLFNRDAACLG